MESEKKSEVTLSPKKAGLSKSARDLLARVRASPSPERVFGLEPAAADAMARGVIDPLIEGAALPLSKLNQYRWYVSGRRGTLPIFPACVKAGRIGGPPAALEIGSVM